MARGLRPGPLAYREGAGLCLAGSPFVTLRAMSELPPPADVAASLLAHLRVVLALPELEYATPPKRLTGGFDTSVYAFELAGAAPPFDVPLVVRIFGRGEDSEARAPYEAAIQGAIAGQEFPAPAVLHVCKERDALGGPFLITALAPGRRLVDALFGPAVFKVPATLARLHARLHRLDIELLRAALAAAEAPALPTIPGDALARLRRDVDAAGLSSPGACPALARKARPRCLPWRNDASSFTAISIRSTSSPRGCK